MPRINKVIWGLGLLGIADTALILAISGGINLGTVLPGIGGAAFIVWAIFRPRASLDFSFLKHWSLKTAAFALFTAWLLTFVAVEAMILNSAAGNADPEADWYIVLGAGLRGDRPSLTLRRRLIAASAYLKRYPDARGVLSGGRGLNEALTEAEVMRRYLVDDGIAPSRIFLEVRATSTYENLRYSKEVTAKAGAREGDRICVVSNDFHLLRVRMLARRLGMDIQAMGAPTPWYLLPNVCLREYFAIVKSFLLDRL